MNVLIIMSDEHSNQVMGCSGHPVVKTPVLDRLAAEGTMFTNCYTNSPLCAPGRASFFTGRYVNRLGTWDNGTPYDGRIQGMSQYMDGYGQKIHSFGKWDFHPDGEYPGIISPKIGVRTAPDIGGFLRNSDKVKPGIEKRYDNIGIREGTHKDDQTREQAVEWLKNRRKDENPWVLYVGYLHPHFPFFVQQDNWDYYDSLVKSIPDVAKEPYSSLNEPLKAHRRYFRSDAAGEETVRKAHVGYYALTSEMDKNVGQLLDTLEKQGMIEDTLIIYTSDHGEQLGHHGLWWKCCLFEESCHVPLIMKGPGIQKGKKVDVPVSLVDIFPTVCQALDIPVPQDIDGRTLLNLAKGLPDVKRNDFTFSEYHGHGMPVGTYMIRWKNWKYIYYAGYEPQLFDLDSDKEEVNDLVSSAGKTDMVKNILAECEKRLRMICDPEEVDSRAKAFQTKMKKDLGIEDYSSFDKDGNETVRKGTVIPHPESALKQ